MPPHSGFPRVSSAPSMTRDQESLLSMNSLSNLEGGSYVQRERGLSNMNDDMVDINASTNKKKLSNGTAKMLKSILNSSMSHLGAGSSKPEMSSLERYRMEMNACRTKKEKQNYNKGNFPQTTIGLKAPADVNDDELNSNDNDRAVVADKESRRNILKKAAAAVSSSVRNMQFIKDDGENDGWDVEIIDDSSELEFNDPGNRSLDASSLSKGDKLKFKHLFKKTASLVAISSRLVNKPSNQALDQQVEEKDNIRAENVCHSQEPSKDIEASKVPEDNPFSSEDLTTLDTLSSFIQDEETKVDEKEGGTRSRTSRASSRSRSRNSKSRSKSRRRMIKSSSNHRNDSPGTRRETKARGEDSITSQNKRRKDDGLAGDESFQSLSGLSGHSLGERPRRTSRRSISGERSSSAAPPSSEKEVLRSGSVERRRQRRGARLQRSLSGRSISTDSDHSASELCVQQNEE